MAIFTSRFKKNLLELRPILTRVDKCLNIFDDVLQTKPIFQKIINESFCFGVDAQELFKFFTNFPVSIKIFAVLSDNLKSIWAEMS